MEFFLPVIVSGLAAVNIVLTTQGTPTIIARGVQQQLGSEGVQLFSVVGMVYQKDIVHTNSNITVVPITDIDFGGTSIDTEVRMLITMFPLD